MVVIDRLLEDIVVSHCITWTRMMIWLFKPRATREMQSPSAQRSLHSHVHRAYVMINEKHFIHVNVKCSVSFSIVS